MRQVLYDAIERDGIIVEYAALAATRDKLLGLYYIDNVLGRPVILLDHSLRGRTAEHDTVLAEEVGHHVTLPRTSLSRVHACYAARVEISKDDARAIRWACKVLIPDDQLRIAVRKGYREAWQLAEYFQVTEWLVHQKYGYLRECARAVGCQILQALEALEAAGA
jgi:Domain of unknown function (DUF955).